MHSDDITMGDLAYASASRAVEENKTLKDRVTILEDKVDELVEAINHLALHCNCESLDDFPVKEA